MPETSASRPASTILLLRDGAKEIEVFMMVRHHQIEFNSGALVFPGGSVDAGDNEIVARADLYSGGEGLSESDRGFRIAAIRETFEESGILLARAKGAGTPIDARRAGEIADKHRVALNEHKISFLSILADNGLQLALDTLVPYAHWITPEGMPKRFDTWFFLAAAPPDQLGAHDGRESTDSIWGVAARGGGGRRERPLQAAVPDHAQPDPPRQAGQRGRRAGARPRHVGRHGDAGHDQDRNRPPAPHSPRSRL
ncbi:8-oxo-dGTP pyrophosphatase MutT (NUDIX family) [Bradyrhizobium sp. i1.7.7]